MDPLLYLFQIPDSRLMHTTFSVSHQEIKIHKTIELKKKKIMPYCIAW